MARRLAGLVVNPGRFGDPDRLRQAFTAASAGGDWAEPLVLTTTAQDPGAAAASEAATAGASVVFAVGGDGTVRACAGALAGTQVPLAIVPMGSANLTARALGIPSRLGAALEVGLRGADRRIDLATADGATFAAMAGIGLDAAVVGATADVAKRLAGWPAYAAAAVSQLLQPPATFTVRLDESEPLIRRARSVAVGNCGLLPGGFRILPDAELDDGMLDVAILAPGLLGWASVGYRVIAASRRDDSGLERYRARRVEVRVGAVLPRQADGEMIGPGSSLTVAVQPGALLVRVPPG
ncbi:MAG TPA: diacylglycerol kinase family protein [Streptosporangiaceae bacterium]|jgi:diacylglycerol kinase family enzyme